MFDSLQTISGENLKFILSGKYFIEIGSYIFIIPGLWYNENRIVYS